MFDVSFSIMKKYANTNQESPEKTLWYSTHHCHCNFTTILKYIEISPEIYPFSLIEDLFWNQGSQWDVFPPPPKFYNVTFSPPPHACIIWNILFAAMFGSKNRTRAIPCFIVSLGGTDFFAPPKIFGQMLNPPLHFLAYVMLFNGF